MAEMQWFRMWCDAVDNPKLRLLAFEDRWHFIAICCLKRSGLIDKTDDPNRDRMIAVKLGVQARELDEIRRRLIDVRLVDEQLNPIGWLDRQFQGDTSTDRVRRFREKQKDKRFRNVSETAPETDTEKEEDAREAREPPPDDLDSEAWERWIQYRREIRKPFKPASIPAAQRKLAGFGSDQAAVVEQSIAQGWTGLFPLKDGPKTKPKDRGFVC